MTVPGVRSAEGDRPGSRGIRIRDRIRSVHAPALQRVVREQRGSPWGYVGPWARPSHSLLPLELSGSVGRSEQVASCHFYSRGELFEIGRTGDAVKVITFLDDGPRVILFILGRI